MSRGAEKGLRDQGIEGLRKNGGIRRHQQLEMENLTTRKNLQSLMDVSGTLK